MTDEAIVKTEPTPRPQLDSRAVIVAIAAWLVPGLGHALLRMWGRALACFFSVGALVYAGAGMRGNIFTWEGADPFSRLGFVADAGSGLLYWIARSIEGGVPDVSHSYGDYGTRLLAAAGVLNFLIVLHAYESAKGRKA